MAGTAIALVWAGIEAPASADVAGQPREAVVAQYQSTLLPTFDVASDWTGSVDGCSPGTTSDAYQQATLTAINYMRALVALPGVALDAGMSAQAQAAALIMTAQGDLSHDPPASWACWTAQGRAGASRSNLALGSAGPEAIVRYMEDLGSNNAHVGHRRWILNSSATTMGTGDTARSNALMVIGGPRASSPGTWIPWPTSGYFPWQLEPGGRWSLGLPGASFDAASVAVSIGGVPIPVTVAPTQYGRGDSTVAWDMSLPQPTRTYHPEDMNVDVTVAGIRLGDGSTITQSYQVNLVDAAPHTPPAATALTSVRRNAGGILAAWAPTEDDGGEAVAYVVSATPLGAKGAKRAPTRTCTASGTSCQLPRIRRDVSYRVTLLVRNALGDSDSDSRVSPRPRGGRGRE